MLPYSRAHNVERRRGARTALAVAATERARAARTLRFDTGLYIYIYKNYNRIKSVHFEKYLLKCVNITLLSI